MVGLSTASRIHEQMALVPKSPIRHFQTISPFTGTEKLGRVTILVRERAPVGLEVAHIDTGGKKEEHDLTDTRAIHTRPYRARKVKAKMRHWLAVVSGTLHARAFTRIGRHNQKHEFARSASLLPFLRPKLSEF